MQTKEIRLVFIGMAMASLLRNYLRFSFFEFHSAYTCIPEMFDGISRNRTDIEKKYCEKVQ
jgi:hypothetical protein